MNRSFFRLAALMLLPVVAAPGGALAAQRESPLVLAMVPQENPEKLIGDMRAITTYLSRELGIKVTGYVTQDHAAAVEALASQAADISFMGALPYVIAHSRVGAQVVLSEVYRGQPSYAAHIFVRKDSPIRSLADLKGKIIAFADPLSESGYLYPLDMLVSAGLLARGADPATFFSRVYFAGGYQQAMQALAGGLVDAAGASMYATLLLPPAQQSEVRTLAESGEIPSHAVIVRKGLEAPLREAFVQAMLKLNQPDKRDLLKHVYSPDGYVRADHGKYAPVEALARLYGLIK